MALLLLPVDLLLCRVLIPAFDAWQPGMGLMGAAAATTLTALLGTVVSGLLVYIEFHCLMEWRAVARILTAGLITWLAGLNVHLSGMWVVVEVAGLFVIYFGLLAAMRELRAGDLARLKEVIVKKRPSSDRGGEE